MNIYYCTFCKRILTQWEIEFNKTSVECSCGGHQYRGANPTIWYLIKTFQIFRVYRHAVYYYLINKYKKEKIKDYGTKKKNLQWFEKFNRVR